MYELASVWSKRKKDVERNRLKGIFGSGGFISFILKINLKIEVTMKKLTLFLLLVAALFTSCEETKETMSVTRTNEYINVNGCDYCKVKLGKHDMYQYTFSTYCGKGSDIIHLDDLCEYCSGKENKEETNQ